MSIDIVTMMASAAFAANPPLPTRSKRNDPLRPRAIMALAAACYILAISGNNDDGVVIVSAFSPPYRASPSPLAIIHGVNSAQRYRKTNTGLAYKHLDNGDENNDAYNANKNKTVLDGNVVYYNDLEDDTVAFSTNNYNASSSKSSIGTNDNSRNSARRASKLSAVDYLLLRSNDSLNHELTDTIKQNQDAKKKKKAVVENWKTMMNQRNKKRTVFHASNYLESLSASTSSTNDTTYNDGSSDNDNKNDDLLRALRDQQANITNSNLLSTQQAFLEATRRTHPKEAIAKRIEDVQSKPQWVERNNTEREQLEGLYGKQFLEKQARERKEEIIDGKEEEAVVVPGDGGIPILDILSRPSVVDAPPLLIGTTLTFAYSDLTPFQKRALDVARLCHEERIQRMKVESSNDEELDDNEVMGTAPIIAIIDSYTASAMESLSSDSSTTTRRYATLASIEMVESDNNGSVDESYSEVKLVGVGRVFLHDYFSSKDAGMKKDEEELSKLLARLQDFGRQKQNDEDEDATITTASEHDNEDDELPVVMAEFDLFFDNYSYILSVSKESSTEYSQDVTKLYRTANKVYRLHEERKKLVAGLRAGEARLQMRKKKRAEDDDENCAVDFEDRDGLGLVDGVLMDGDYTIEDDFEEETLPAAPPALELSENGTPTTPRSILETMDNYGFGSYGTLSTIPDLTTQLTSLLKPYYLPTHRAREEYNAEVASMVIFRTLEEYASPQEVAMSLLVPSATERLELGYTIMMRHVGELKDLVRIVSEELMGCGEECTDSW